MPSMPFIAIYRGVEIHDFQSEERIRSIVCREIDAVMKMDNVETLMGFLGDQYRSPEARLLAARKLLDPAEEKEARHRKAGVDTQLVRALGAGLDSLAHAAPSYYGTILAIGLPPGSLPLPSRPQEYREAIEAAIEAANASERAAEERVTAGGKFAPPSPPGGRRH